MHRKWPIFIEELLIRYRSRIARCIVEVWGEGGGSAPRKWLAIRSALQRQNISRQDSMDGAVTTDSTLDTLTTGSDYFFFDEQSLLHPISLMACLSYDFNVAALHELEPGPFFDKACAPPNPPRVGAGPPHDKGCTSKRLSEFGPPTALHELDPARFLTRVGPGCVAQILVCSSGLGFGLWKRSDHCKKDHFGAFVGCPPS